MRLLTMRIMHSELNLYVAIIFMYYYLGMYIWKQLLHNLFVLSSPETIVHMYMEMFKPRSQFSGVMLRQNSSVFKSLPR
jgi:hypothetical protein